MKKRLLSAFVSLCMIVSLLPTMAFAETGVQDSGIVTSEGGLCEHHTQHDENCGYTEGTAEIPCSHEHTEDCYTLVKEVKEESGLNVTADRVIAIQDRSRHNPPIYAYGICKVFIQCSLIGGCFEPNIETIASGFFSEDDLPDLATDKTTRDQVQMCFAAYHSAHWDVKFD